MNDLGHRLSLEDRLRPPATARRGVDLVVLLCLLLLTVLLPAWPPFVGLAPDGSLAFQPDRIFNDFLGQMLSIYLLPALGMLLVMRCGGIDLGIWANMALGGAVAAGVINALSGGRSDEAQHVAHWGLLAGAGAGLLAGGVNALLVMRLRIPSPIATLAVAGAITLAMHLMGPDQLTIPDTTFARWHLVQDVQVQASGEATDGETPPRYRVISPLSVTRMLLVLCAYAAVLIAIMARSSGSRPAPEPRRLLRMSLLASGLLAGLGGAAWLMSQPTTPLHDDLIGTMRIPVAAVLAGALALSGPGRTQIACLLLPPAMAVAMAWRQETAGLVSGWEGSWVLLLVLAALVQVAVVRRPSGHGRRWDALLAGVAMMLLAASGRIGHPESQGLLSLIGFAQGAAVARLHFVVQAVTVALGALAAVLIIRNLVRSQSNKTTEPPATGAR